MADDGLNLVSLVTQNQPPRVTSKPATLRQLSPGPETRNPSSQDAMANHLNMAQTHSIEVLLKRGWSQRRVARDLGIDRGTVSKVYKRLNAPEVTSTTPSKPGPPAVSNSACQPHHDRIQAKLELGLSAERIFSDLRQEVGFEHSYQSVKRYVRKLKATPPKRVWRMECAPGEEAQIDFGFAKTLLDKDGKQRMSNVLRITLSHSRKGYTETLPAQSTDHFLTAIENAFRHFGGVPATLRIDNLKAAVKQADWYDPELHPKILAFAEHYQTTIIPTRPYTPEHKGKVESDVNYVKINALKGHQFSDIASQNAHLRQWEEHRRRPAHPRHHQTTRSHTVPERREASPSSPYPPKPFTTSKKLNAPSIVTATSNSTVPTTKSHPNTSATSSGSAGTLASSASTTPT